MDRVKNFLTGPVKGVVDFAYDRLVIALTLTVVMIYLNFHEYFWAPYILSPAAVIVITTLLIEFLYVLYDYEIISLVWEFVRFIVRWVFGYLKSWFSNKIVVGLFAAAVVHFVYYNGRWIWYNIDIFQIFNSVIELIVDTYRYFTDPKAIMLSVINVLDKLHVRLTLDAIRNGYVNEMERRTQKGDASVLIIVTCFSLALILAGIIIRAIWVHIIINCIRYARKSLKESANSGIIRSIIAAMQEPKEAHIIDGEQVRDVLGEEEGKPIRSSASASSSGK